MRTTVNTQGFSLIELCAALCLLALMWQVSAGIIKSVSAVTYPLKAYAAQDSLTAFLTHMRADSTAVVPLSGHPFSGDDKSVTFLMVRGDAETGPALYMVTYSLRASNGGMVCVRKSAHIPQDGTSHEKTFRLNSANAGFRYIDKDGKEISLSPSDKEGVISSPDWLIFYWDTDTGRCEQGFRVIGKRDAGQV